MPPLPQKIDYRKVSGQEKAAMLLLSLSEDAATKLFAMMDPEEIKEISQHMSRLGTVRAEVVEKLFVDFTDNMSTHGTLMGSFESTERLLRKVLGGEAVEGIMEDIRGPAGRTMWDKLNNVNEELLANYLKNEYPQTVAVVITKLAPEHAANVLALLPDSFALEVVQRMLSMENVQKDVLNDVEATLRTEFMSNLARTNRRDSHEVMAEIFNNFDRTTENRFMTKLEAKNQEAAERIRALMFTFEDLSRLDPSGIQTLLRQVDKPKLALALKGASEGLREMFFANMSNRVARLLREDMEGMGPVRLREVDDAQVLMVALAKELAAKGEIFIADDREEDEIIY